MYQIHADNSEINIDNVEKWLYKFKNHIQPKRIWLGKYYDGENEIVKQGAVSGRPNYSVNVNMAKYITDVATGYFVGKPVTYSSENQQVATMLDKIEFLNKACRTSELDFKIAGDMSCYGVGYQLVLVEPGTGAVENRIKLKRLQPERTFYVVDNTILENPLCAIYFYDYEENNQFFTKTYVYTETDLYIFKGYKNALTSLESQQPHYMGTIPIIQSLNNDDAFGDYQQVAPLLDALSLSVSNTTDDLQSIANAILCATGGALTEDQIILINKYKVANLPTGSTMNWLAKNIDSTSTQQSLDNLLKFIFQISQVPDLTDEAFGGNQSGVAMQYKLWGINQLWETKVKKYKCALYTRINIFLHLLQYRFNNPIEVSSDIDITFYKNLPTDNNETYQMVQGLKGTVSERTLLTNISIVDDVDEEIEQIQKEKAENADNYGFNNPLSEAEDDKQGILEK